MLPAILNGLADLRCQAGEFSAGQALAAGAVADARERFGKAHWQSAQSALTLAYCRALAGEAVDRAETVQWLATLRGKWGAKGPFAQRAAAQARALGK